MKFIELLNVTTEDIDCDIIVGGADMNHSLVWYAGDMEIKEYGLEKYAPLLQSECVILSNGNIEILCDDWRMGMEFFTALAGYISCSEYDRLFLEKTPV